MASFVPSECLEPWYSGIYLYPALMHALFHVSLRYDWLYGLPHMFTKINPVIETGRAFSIYLVSLSSGIACHLPSFGFSLSLLFLENVLRMTAFSKSPIMASLLSALPSLGLVPYVMMKW